MTTAASTEQDRPPRKSRQRRRVALFSLAAVAIAIAAGSDRTAADARSGTQFEGPPPSPAPARARLATFNMHAGRDAAGRDAWERTVETVRDFDFVALQEVRGGLVRAGQAERLGRAIDLTWCFAPSERRFWHDHFGNAALSRLPVTRWESVPLEGTRGKGYRNYAEIVVEIGGRSATIVVTHIDRRADRAAQLDRVIEVFMSQPEPAILMGDLNSTADDPALRRLLATPGVSDAHALRVDVPGRIDWILLRGLDVHDAGVRDLGASDHPCYWAVVAAR